MAYTEAHRNGAKASKDNQRGTSTLAKMTNPHDALISFQAALDGRELDLQRCKLNNQMQVHADQPQGVMRLTYAMVEKDVVTSLAIFVTTEPIDGTPCFQVGYAVPESLRRQGRAKSIVKAAIDEMRHGFARTELKSFYVEAIVGEDNPASKLVAATTISEKSESVVDEVSGLPAIRFVGEFKVGD